MKARPVVEWVCRSGMGVLNGGDQVVSLLGTHDAGHVLDADGGSAHGLQLVDHFHVLLVGVHGRGGVGQGAGSDGAGLDGGLHGDLQVVGVVQGVEDTDDVDAVLHSLLDEHLHEVIGVVGVAQDVLAPQEHLELGLGSGGADLPQSLPGVLVQVAQADVEGSAAPALDGVVTGVVDGLQHGGELVVGQAGSDEGLVGVTQHSLYKLNFLSHFVVTSVDWIF